MKWFVRIVALSALLMGQQVMTAYVGSAQVDPCEPVPIPGLCEDEDPPDTPTPPPPPDTGGGGGDDVGGGGGGGGLGGGGGGSGQNGGGNGGGGGNGLSGLTDIPKAAKGPFLFGGSNDTERLIQILAKLKPYGVSVRDALLRVAGPFPVAGPSYWSNDWHACRDGCTRFHEGLDMFGPEGTPLVAIADGIVTQKVVGDLSGISVEIQDAHGVQYFYAHLSAWPPGLRTGQRVEQGDVIGYLGNTGNAITTPHHLHLEVQPNGIPVPPKPFVDDWLELAEYEAKLLVERITGQEFSLVRGASVDFRLTRLLDLAGGAGTTTVTGEQLLPLLGIQPSVSSLDLTNRWLGQMSWEIDWTSQSDAQLAALAQEYGQIFSQDLSGASPWSPFGPEATSGQGLDEVGD